MSETPGETRGHKTWGGRFTSGTDDRVEAYTESISFDSRLYRHDVLASQAHARMLASCGLLTHDEAEKICSCLTSIGRQIELGEMPFSFALEDIHTHIEKALIDRLGDLGRKLHTARSRNDQVVTDVRLWVRESIDKIVAALKELQRSFLTLGEVEREVILPGYTHMQRAQPILAPHYCLAYVEKFERDLERLLDCRKRVNILSLGSAALAGTTLPIDRAHVAAQLGFDSFARNSLDATSDRDFAAEFVFCLSLIAVHLSGWSEEWILWNTFEFGLLELPEEFCTGSSIMPHKKNPDVLELTRGKSARVIADLQNLLVLLKGLPMAYNRDLQEDKPPLFDACDTVLAALSLAAPLVEKARFNRERINARLEDGFLDATTLMEWFIARGLPMRTAHEAVGRLVHECEKRGIRRLADLPVERFDEVVPGQGRQAREVLGVRNAIEAFRSAGSTAPAEVEQQLAFWRTRLAGA